MSSASHTVAEVVAFLETHFEDVASVEALGGEWSQAFSFRAGKRALVVRFGAYVDDYRKDEVASRYAGPVLPIPRVAEIGEAFDAYYAVSEWLPGAPLDEVDGPGLERALPSILRFLDALREADVSATRGYGLWAPDGDAPYGSWREFLLAARDDPPSVRTGGWRAALEARPADLDVFEAGYAKLCEVAPQVAEERRLVHADILGDNVRILDGEVTAVVDWGQSMYGDFVYDLARLTFWPGWYPAGWSATGVVDAALEHYASIGLEVPAFAERLRACQVHIGLDAQAYDVATQRWDELAWAGQRTLELAQP